MLLNGSVDGINWTKLCTGNLNNRTAYNKVTNFIPEHLQVPKNDTGWKYIKLKCTDEEQSNLYSITDFPKINICAQKFNRNKLVAFKDTNQYAEWTHQIPAINAKPGGQYYAAYLDDGSVLGTSLTNMPSDAEYAFNTVNDYATMCINNYLASIVYYSPVKLKLNQLICNFINVANVNYTINTYAKIYRIYGSNDGKSWDKLKYWESLPPYYYNNVTSQSQAYRNDTFIINVNAQQVYQYFKIVGIIANNPYTNDSIVFPKIKLVAKQLVEIETPEYDYWTMPTLTENGIIGESDYAVTAEPTTITYASQEIFKSFDNTPGGAYTYCSLSGQMAEASLIWFSKNELKFNAIKFKNPSVLTADNFPSKISLSGSNDNSNWIALATNIKYDSTVVNAEQTIFITPSLYSTKNPGFKYLKISMTNLNNDATKYCSFPEITIFADKYTGKIIDPAISKKLGGIKLVDFTEYQEIQNKYNYCAAFGIDIQNNKLRLPDYRNTFLMGANNTNNGTTIPAGLPNIKGIIGDLCNYVTTRANGAFVAYNTSGTDVGGGGSGVFRYTFDASRCSPIYSNDCTTVQPPAITVNYYIQAYNKVKIEESTRNLIENVNTNTANINALNTVISDIKSNVTNMMKNNLFMPDWNTGIDITSVFTNSENTKKAYVVECDSYIIAWTFNTYIYLFFKEDCTYLNIWNPDLPDRNYIFMALDSSGTLTSNHAYCPAGTILYMDSTIVVDPTQRTNNVI